MESRTVDVSGIRIRWEEEGEGPPVVFIHGIPTSPRLWRHVVPRVQGARSMAWERVGYGASIEEGWERDISVAKQTDYLAYWIREVGLESVFLVGHDLGETALTPYKGYEKTRNNAAALNVTTANERIYEVCPG